MEQYNLKTYKLYFKGHYHEVEENSEKHLRMKHMVEERIIRQTDAKSYHIIVD